MVINDFMSNYTAHKKGAQHKTKCIENEWHTIEAPFRMDGDRMGGEVLKMNQLIELSTIDFEFVHFGCHNPSTSLI